MRFYYYRATKRIDKTALIEFLKKEAIKNKDITIELREVYGILYFCTSHISLLENVDELYPRVFISSEPPPFEGIAFFTNS